MSQPFTALHLTKRALTGQSLGRNLPLSLPRVMQALLARCHEESMSDDHRRPIDPVRVGLMSLLLACAAGSLMLLAKGLPITGLGAAIAVLAGVLLTPLIASPMEWLVHRYVYHRPVIPFLRPVYRIHHLSHHSVFFPTWRYVTDGPPRRLPVLSGDVSRVYTSPFWNGMTRAIHFAFYMTLALLTIWLPAWLVTHHLPFLIGAVLGSAIVSNLFVAVHDTIHRPGSHRLIEAQGWFRFLDEHHYIHHVDTEANVNFLLPLADWLFGTLRLSLTPDELARHGSRAQAKLTRKGTGEPARLVAQPPWQDGISAGKVEPPDDRQREAPEPSSDRTPPAEARA
jgi:hypothetical protein